MLIKCHYSLPEQETIGLTAEEKEKLILDEIKQEMANQIMPLFTITKESGQESVFFTTDAVYRGEAIVLTSDERKNIRSLILMLRNNASENIRSIADQLAIYF